MVCTIYGRGGHLGHVTWTIYINFLPSFHRRLHIKFDFKFDWPSSFREEYGGHMHVYIAPGQGQTTPWVNCFSLTHLFSQFSH